MADFRSRLHSLVFIKANVAKDDPRYFITNWLITWKLDGTNDAYATRAEFAGADGPFVVGNTIQTIMGLN